MAKLSGVEIEYCDETWIHFHSSHGMMSVLTDPRKMKKLTQFLLDGYFRHPKKGESREITITIGHVQYVLEGPDEDHFNWHINSGDVVIIVAMSKAELINMIDEFKNPYKFEGEQQ
jgi:ABC-type ATPase with predicted acetyltransferase domain